MNKIMDDVFVHFMPLAVHGCVTCNEDGSYSIFLNSNDSYETQLKTYLHELYHIKKNHLELRNANIAECEAHS